MVSVLLADDHTVVRAGLKALLGTTGWVNVVGEASSGEEALEKARTLKPDIAIMDLAMSGMDGIQATRHITELGLGTKVLVLTIHDEAEYLAAALNAGAVGYLNKSVADTELLGAVEAIIRGHSYLPQQAAALLARRRPRRTSRGEPGREVLSSRELTAIKLYANGFSTNEAGKEMVLSPKTVEGYLARAKSKLGLHSRREVVRFALEAGLLRPEGKP